MKKCPSVNKNNPYNIFISQFFVQHFLVVATRNWSSYYVHAVCLHHVVTSDIIHICFSFSILQSGDPVIHSYLINWNLYTWSCIPDYTYYMWNVKLWISLWIYSAYISQEKHICQYMVVNHKMSKNSDD